ncbi:MAG: hypothetical protein ABFD12_11245 [Syntrophorhabdus sp.]
MKKRIHEFLGKRSGNALCVLLIVCLLISSAYATPVIVTNFQQLMPMIQKMVTQVITEKIQSVWNEEVKIKLEPGRINARAISFLKYDMSSYTQGMISQYMRNNVGAFAKGDGKYFTEVAKSKAQLSLPSANSDFSQFQKKIREVSVLLAGAPGGGYEKMKHFSTADFAAVKLRDVFNQASVAAYERAAQGVFVAEKFRSELSSFNPSQIDSAKSDQAVKDLAKLTYYNTMLQSEILAVMSQGEMRHALEGR